MERIDLAASVQLTRKSVKQYAVASSNNRDMNAVALKVLVSLEPTSDGDLFFH